MKVKMILKAINDKVEDGKVENLEVWIGDFLYHIMH